MRHAYPILFEIPIIEDALATAAEHCAWAINKGIKEINAKKIFVTGGGVWNSHLLKRIAHYFEGEIFVPKKEIVDQKEAICFAFLGIKKLRGEVNVLSSVTGGGIDSSDGIMFVKKVVQK
jgi:anhydro-N-acetylmuramic acid kinase